MRLSDFIRNNMNPIIKEWENFSETLMPSKGCYILRDRAEEILNFIAADIETSQSQSQQITKSQGNSPKSIQTGDSAAETHGLSRLGEGFSVTQVVAEYRALRASITRLWLEEINNEIATLEIRQELIRLNESIDQQLFESVDKFTQALDHSKDLFLGILGHDLRSPLGAIMMSAGIIQRVDALTDKQELLLKQIIKSTERATEIISYLLDLTRARLGTGIPVDKKPMDLGDMVQHLVDEMRSINPDHEIILKSAGNLEGEWDGERIGQALSNLMNNALQYSSEDSTITVEATGRPEEVTISVHNHGIPIAPDVQEIIFDSLNRGSLQESHQTNSINLGLGLYISKEIVKSHGGTIEVFSSTGAGTTFTMRFPR